MAFPYDKHEEVLHFKATRCFSRSNFITTYRNTRRSILNIFTSLTTTKRSLLLDYISRARKGVKIEL